MASHRRTFSSINRSAGMFLRVREIPRRTGSEDPFVTRVDHLYARVDDPRALFLLLTERLALPRSYGFARVPGFEGGAVSLGNIVFLEALRYAPGRGVAQPASPGLDGLALEAAAPIVEAATELSRRRIPHSPPITYAGDPAPFSFGASLERAGLKPGEGPLWSMVVLGGFFGDRRRARQFRIVPSSGESPLARALGRLQGRLMSSKRFADLAMAAGMTSQPTVWVHQFDAADMRAANAAAADELSACGGGALGVERVREVVLGARDLAVERERWQRLLHPTAAGADGRWHLGDGPALRLVEDDADRIRCMVCEVSSVARATEFLEREQMLDTTPEGEARISPAALQGVEIRLAECATRR
jgi:hypothetical protein